MFQTLSTYQGRRWWRGKRYRTSYQDPPGPAQLAEGTVHRLSFQLQMDENIIDLTVKRAIQKFLFLILKKLARLTVIWIFENRGTAMLSTLF